MTNMASVSPDLPSFAERAAGQDGPTLSVQNLTTVFATRAGTFTAVDDVSFDVWPSECLGIVGESGSGKSVAALSILGLVDYPGRVAAGEIQFRGEDLRRLRSEALRAVRGSRLAVVFQDPQTAFNPLFTVGRQMTDVVRAHRRCTVAEAGRLAAEKLRLVGVSAPEQRLRAYPWELSGGLRQRVAIAMALLLDPDLVIADEPTTALDVSIQAQIVELLVDLKQRLGFSLIFISHDLGVISAVADRVLVMYAGRAVERGPVGETFARPLHPYTAALVASAPTLESVRGQPLPTIQGSPPGPGTRPAGCVFAPRCPRARQVCWVEQPPLAPILPGREVACHFPLLDIASAIKGTGGG